MWSPGKMTVFLSTGSWCGLNQHRPADPYGVMPVHEWALQSVIFQVQNRPKSGGEKGTGRGGMQHTGGTACRPGDRGALGPVPPLPAAPEAVPPPSPSPPPPGPASRGPPPPKAISGACRRPSPAAPPQGLRDPGRGGGGL